MDARLNFLPLIPMVLLLAGWLHAPLCAQPRFAGSDAKPVNATGSTLTRPTARLASRSMASLLPPPPDSIGGSTGSAEFALPPEVSGPYGLDSLQTASSIDAPPSDRRTAAQELDAAKIIARVGDQVVLAGDILGQVNQFLHNQIQKMPPEQRGTIPEEILEQQRWRLVEQLLPQTIDAKLVYLDFMRSIPKERWPDVEDNLYKSFDDQQLPILIERASVQSAADLDSMLRSFGTSLDQQRRAFAEQVASFQWRRRNATDYQEISHDDMLSYYRDHADEYRIEARAKWEQLTALYGDYATPRDAELAVGSMGNEVLGGAAFAAVAKRSSKGPTAFAGGANDWTTKGSLRSVVLDEAIFSLPVARLSQPIHDEDGCHIIRVIERQDEGVVSFADAQAGIKEKIREGRSEKATAAYVEKLRARTPIWTMFDDIAQGTPNPR